MTQPLSRMALPAQVNDVRLAADASGVRVGKVTAYTAGSITVAISGSDTLVNASYLSSYFPNVGDNVIVLKNDTSWVVLGGFGQTQTRLIPVTNIVATVQSTTSTSFTDLATVGPTVAALVGSSGTAIVTLSSGVFPGSNDGGWMGVQVTNAAGTITNAPDTNRSLYVEQTSSATGTFNIQMSRSILFSNLTPGLNTFQAKYRCDVGVGCNWQDREMIVLPY